MLTDDFLGIDPVAGARIHDRLRLLLLAYFPHTPSVQIAGALAYELASLIASVSPDTATAQTLIDHFAEIQTLQIVQLGVGKAHP